MTFTETKRLFDNDEPITLKSKNGELVTFTRPDIARMFGVAPKDVKLNNVLKFGKYKLP